MKQLDKNEKPWRGVLKKILLVTVVLFTFSFNQVNAQNSIQLGEGENTTNYVPIYYLYNYSYSQAIYTAEEIQEQGGIAGSISKLMYKPTNDVSTSNWKDWVVYIGQTDKTNFDGTTDWVALENLTEVFDGEIDSNIEANQWFEITLDAAFDWDGESNIVVAVDQNTADYGTNPGWASYNLAPESGNKALYYYSDGTNPDPSEPPSANSTTDEVAQIVFHGNLLADCEGTPDPGTVAESEYNVCAGVEFALVTENASGPEANLVRIWQSSPQGEDNWTDIEGAESPHYVLDEGITDPTDFRYSLVCGEGEKIYSEVIEVNLNPGNECYCFPEGSSNNGDEIRNFTLSNINNDSETSEGEDGYSDYTETIPAAEINIGESYVASLTSGSGSESHGAAIWIDLNDDGHFAEDEMVAFLPSEISSNSTVDFPAFIASDNPGTHRLRVQYTYNQSGDALDPCTISTGYSETEDYLVEYIILEDCQGMPTAGTPDEDELQVCAGIPFTLSVSDDSEAANNLYRRWQSSPAGEDDWSDIPESVTSSYVVQDGVDEPTDFRYVVTCDEEDTDISDVIEVMLNPDNECYCIPEGTSSSFYINNFSTFGGEENIENLNSGFSDGGYGDFTETHIVSQAHTLSVDFEADYGSTFGTKIWVDWNQDGVFDEDEIVYQASFYSSSESGSIEVPESAELGETRMRIGISTTPVTGPNDPCQSGSGEFEDYTFEVLALEDCQGIPTAGTPDEYELEVCAGMLFELSVSDATATANNLYRRWQSSPAGEDDWTDITGANSSTYIVPEGIEEPTDFRFVVTCNDEDTDISDIIEVTLKPANECYCTPENNSSSSYFISNVSTIDALQNIDNDTEFSDNGYGDFTESEVIIVYPGQEFDYSVTGDNSNMIYAVWLDLDQNGNFDGPSEKIGQSDSYISPPFTGSYEVPADLEEGFYRLRIRSSYIGADIGPCEDNSYGETEDYTLQVIFPDCFPPVNIQVDYITDSSAHVTWDGSDEDSWVVIYGEQGFDPETEGDNVIEVTGTSSADITGLNEDTNYQVYIKTVCGDDESFLIGPRTFTTNITPPVNTRLCDAIPLEANSGCIGGPYTTEHAFEESGEPIGSCLNDYRGENTVWFTFEASGTGEAVISTDFNNTEIQTEIVVFEAPTDCEDMSTLGEEVGCAAAADEGVIELDGLNPGETYYVKVAGFNNAEGQFCVEVQLEDVAVCYAPTEIAIGEISEDTVEVSWTTGGDENQWKVIYGAAGFNPESEGDSEIVNTTEITLTDLSPETDYEVYVRAICTNLNSDLAGPEVFTTEPMSVDSQIFADFTFYPNPVQDQLTLKAGSQIEKVDVYNLLGQNVISAQPNSLEAQINTAALQTGVYLMEVSINGSQKSFRVVKK